MMKPLTIITKHSILDVATVLDPPLRLKKKQKLSETKIDVQKWVIWKTFI